MFHVQATSSPATGGMRAGIVADGLVKLLLAAGYVAAAGPLGRLLGVAVWLMVVSGVFLLVCGLAEIRYARVRPLRVYLWLMAAYDTGWVLVTVVALLLGSGGGEIWVGYQAVASAVLAAFLVLWRIVPTSLPRRVPGEELPPELS
ncbi:hypothetical protein [Actinomadura hibisca]|uniref:hypothetical protein n=1 Tax=Actinomadura hibisca TaxID=68565 RepID=UPI00082A2585|nr:hypothetical protein [Actinomadura hibisca]